MVAVPFALDVKFRTPVGRRLRGAESLVFFTREELLTTPGILCFAGVDVLRSWCQG